MINVDAGEASDWGSREEVGWSGEKRGVVSSSVEDFVFESDDDDDDDNDEVGSGTAARTDATPPVNCPAKSNMRH